MESRPRLWSYATGVKAVNRIRVYERRPGGPIYVEWYDRLGRHQKTLTTVADSPVTDKSVAKKIADAMAAAQARKRHQQTLQNLLHLPQTHTLGELFKAYHTAHPDWSEGHRRAQKVNRRFWGNHLGVDTPLTSITPAKAQEAINAELRANPEGVDGFSARTQQKRLRYLKDAFGYATDQLMWLTPAQNNLRGLKMPRVRGRSKPYSREEVRALAPATEQVDLRLAVMTHLAWISGRRSTAILTLPAAAYEDQGEYGRVQFPGATDKARRSGEVYVYGRAKELLEELLTSRAVQTSGMLFPTGDLAKDAPAGVAVSDQAMRDWLRRAEEIAKVPSIKGRLFHGLKRRYATEAMRLDPQAAALQSGTNEAMLRGAYVQDDAEPKKDLARHMDSLLTPDPGEV